MNEELKKMMETTEEFVTKDEIKEIMHGAGQHAWYAIQNHMCDGDECLFPKFMEGVYHVTNLDYELAYCLIRIQLKEAGKDEFLDLLKTVCDEDDFAMWCFVESFNEVFNLMLEDAEEDDMEENTEEEMPPCKPAVRITLEADGCVELITAIQTLLDELCEERAVLSVKDGETDE